MELIFVRELALLTFDDPVENVVHIDEGEEQLLQVSRFKYPCIDGSLDVLSWKSQSFSSLFEFSWHAVAAGAGFKPDDA